MSVPSAAKLVQSLGQNIKGKTILLLGASPGSYGARFADIIKSAEPAKIILAGRSATKLATVIEGLAPIPAPVVQIDMMSFKSVRAAAAEVASLPDKIDVLINSIGSMAPPYKLSEDGWESQLQTNHLGFFLFTNLLIEKILKDKTRIVNISSEGYCQGPPRYLDPNFDDGTVYDPFTAYGQAKSSQILFASALARKYGDQGIKSFSIQPGHSPETNLDAQWAPELTMEDFFLSLRKVGLAPMLKMMANAPPLTLDQNLANYVIGAFDPAVEKDNGAYIRGGEVIDKDTMHSWAIEERQEKRLWAWSEKLVGEKFPAAV